MGFRIPDILPSKPPTTPEDELPASKQPNLSGPGIVTGTGLFVTGVLFTSEHPTSVVGRAALVGGAVLVAAGIAFHPRDERPVTSAPSVEELRDDWQRAMDVEDWEAAAGYQARIEERLGPPLE